eukprot:scaffold24472_cov76-Attheya_sp.AAC.3
MAKPTVAESWVPTGSSNRHWVGRGESGDWDESGLAGRTRHRRPRMVAWERKNHILGTEVRKANWRRQS